MLSRISCQWSVVSYQQSAVSCQWSAVSYQLLAVSCLWSAINRQLAEINPAMELLNLAVQKHNSTDFIGRTQLRSTHSDRQRFPNFHPSFFCWGDEGVLSKRKKIQVRSPHALKSNPSMHNRGRKIHYGKCVFFANLWSSTSVIQSGL